MTRQIGKVSVNQGHIHKFWFEVDVDKEVRLISSDTSFTYIEDDKTGTRSVATSSGECLLLNPITSYNHDEGVETFSYTSDNPDKINISPADNSICLVAPQETSSATITIVGTNGTDTVTRTVDTTLHLTGAETFDVIEGGVAGSARKALSDPLDNALSGANVSTQKSAYSSQDHSSASYVRNSSFLIQSTHAEALTCASPWNSRGAGSRAGTAITPRHVLLAAHYPLSIGDTLRFVTSDNVVVTRTVVQTSVIIYEQASVDALVLLLDSDLPSSITPCKIFPSDYDAYLPAGAHHLSHNAFRIPLISFNRYEQCSIADFRTVNMPPPTKYPFMLWRSPELENRLDFWTEASVGDSGNPLFACINSELWLVSTFRTAYGGPFYGRMVSELNSTIASLDALQGINTGYTATEGDLSSYTTYP
jgi:hypothetical protein